MSVLTFILPFVLLSWVSAGYRNRPKNLPCKIDDAKCLIDLSQWMYDTNVAGIPELGIPGLDPLKHESVVGDLGLVRYNLSNSYLEGMKSCKVKMARINSNYNTMRMEFLCPRTTFSGYYNIEGSLLNYPIKGEGIYSVTSKNFYNTFDLDISYYKVDNKIHYKHTTFKHKGELLGDLDIVLKNLDGTDKHLSEGAQSILRIAKENAKLFMSVIDSPVHRENTKKVMKSMNKILRTIPTSELLQINEKKIKIENV